jgi:hypothetical protein
VHNSLKAAGFRGSIANAGVSVRDVLGVHVPLSMAHSSPTAPLLTTSGIPPTVVRPYPARLEGRPTELSGLTGACKTMKPDPDFEDFARDCIRLAGQQNSRELRTRLLVLAREWMHAAMQEQTGGRNRSHGAALTRSR